MKTLVIAVSVLVLLATTGCSTIVNGKRQIVSINSNVAGAQVTVNGMPVGQTPFAGEIERSSKAIVQLNKEGYVTKTMTMDTSFEPIFWGNIISGGFFGSTTDGVSGAMYKYAPATIQVDLEKKPN